MLKLSQKVDEKSVRNENVEGDRLSSNLKIRILRLGWRRPQGLNRADLGQSWACLQEGKKALQGALGALCGDLHSAIGKVLYPTGKLEEFCLAIGPVAIAYPLHVPSDDNVNVMKHSFRGDGTPSCLGRGAPFKRDGGAWTAYKLCSYIPMTGPRTPAP